MSKLPNDFIEKVLEYDAKRGGGSKSVRADVFMEVFVRELGPYLSIPKEEEQEAKQPIEKIEPLDTKLMEEYRNKDKEDVVVNIIGNKLVEAIDTVNKQQEQINYLLSKQH